MNTNELIKEYKDKICPNCVHYVDKDYDECNITLDINNEAKCINYKCLEFCKKERENKDKFNKEKESKLYVTAKKQNSIMKLV